MKAQEFYHFAKEKRCAAKDICWDRGNFAAHRADSRWIAWQ